ncbi:MAG: protein-(glutamine-N5) methyltransferase, release factor-specific [Ignavibacteriae bacterium]|nr:MAG: protein-(glutamine-N5) methyltransferase, release factor-specific [Ignavibacteriota bacterium]
MLNVLNAIELSTDYLKKKGVKSSRLNAELLLSDILSCKRLDLYLKFDQPLNEEEKTKYRESIKRRGKREPLQYIIGKVEFYGLEFLVNKNVLIPRSETEILIETILGSIPKDKELYILDIGTGSGNIPITLSLNLPNAKISSIDKNNESINVAELNATKHNLNGNVNLINIDFYDFIKTNKNKFDIIVSNPPYVSQNDFNELEPELKEYEPQEALTDFSDGYKFYKDILLNINSLLKEKGKLFFEIGLGQSNEIKKMMIDAGLANIKTINDLQGIERVIFGVLN